ncbi:MAG TPA: protease inhibitor I42 family protein, partial [Promineifilum sp.]|nr:protease inhibitor I42 family protein [Promineifilum sp.]
MLLLVACGGGESAGPTNVYIADENDNGQTVTMGVGDALHLTLPENRSTGYVWSVVTNDESILRPDAEPTYEIEGEAMPGAGGQVTFNFIAAREGRVNLQLILARPQETAVEAAQTFAL